MTIETFSVGEIFCSISVNSRGHLCGYVRLPRYWKIPPIELLKVHGGVTYTEDNAPIAGGFNIGFDCAHAGDYVPALTYIKGIWRTPTYVRDQLFYLCGQLEAICQKE